MSEDAQGNYSDIPRTILDKPGPSDFLYLDNPTLKTNHQVCQFYLLNIS